MTDRERVNQVLGLLMLQNNLQIEAGQSDCVTCATAACTREGILRGKEGYAFYHDGDAESFDEQGNLRGETIYIGFGSLLVDNTEEDYTLVGSLVADRFRQAGFDVEWNGTPGRRIGLRVRQ